MVIPIEVNKGGYPIFFVGKDKEVIMPKALHVHTHLSQSDFKRLIRRESDGRVRQRLTGIMHVAAGKTVPVAARAIGLHERKLCNWVHRFNAEGIEGLKDRPRSGRPHQLTEAQKQSFKERIEAGPTQEDGVVRFRWQEFLAILNTEYGADYTTAKGVLNVVHSLKLSWMTPRQIHPQSDDAKKVEFKKNAP